ncbi:hypothetical protein GLOIN_2v1787200 [Rhizophagus irregularis DAOM 181602=DAOM 197198]|uniref:Uncharacterized protein n=1 Tax=Rhizophagus irregularis (strain DAOM 181602 / DAOM 197198 / MUCL 43194) TaxID=747089 RepID=A0A2P4P6E3_RHIID|nr:hypothetical protein GLOIN_2v1787200 [Rhizophagus irregularis DAOM 181602=DAOM 197198]POG60953.1 hypothetical protein GLOIN_2v1787200 [Rhizophagus irregularis DAOM 181602=DAOM 197198]|eukprot:XP_025167819.1 hypothetical protein GLOIN_2v1787200 [Rhizophagus irregularis DAOM 181602=DAOM 197198]
MSNISTTNNENSQKTAEPALTLPSRTSSSVEQVSGKNSSETRDFNAHLPTAPIIETINDTQQPLEGSTSINGNPPPIEEIPMIDNIFSASNIQAQTSFEGFIPRDSFPPKLTDKEILQKLNNIFVGDKDFIKVRSLKKMTFKFYMISVSTKDKLSYLIKTSPPELQNVKIYEYTQQNIDTLIEHKAAADYLLEQDWCLVIKDSVARILPGNPKHPIYTQQTSAFYKITGLPLNTNAKDLSPLVTHLKGRTCTFTQTSRSSFFKNAFIYVHSDDIKKDYTTITGTKFGEYTIFIFPYTNTKKTYSPANNNSGKSNIQSRPQPDTQGKQKQSYNNIKKNLDGTHQKSTSSWTQQQIP